MLLLKSCFLRALRSFWMIFKIMLPVSIVVKVLQLTGLITIIGQGLSPFMQLMGLPGEMGIVWASSMIANIYGGMIALFSMDIQLTVAQLSVLASIILAAHTFPIELLVVRKAGLKILPQFVLRFVFGLFIGILLYHTYRILNVYNEYPIVDKIFHMPEDPSLWSWLINEAKNYGLVFLIILSLTLIMGILEYFGWIERFEKILEPVLNKLGLGKNIIPITVIGLSLGIAYGGAMMVEETKVKSIAKKDVFYAFVLMSLCHSIIEDSLLMMSIGASFTGVFVARFIFSFLIAWAIIRGTRHLSEEKFQAWFLRK